MAKKKKRTAKEKQQQYVVWLKQFGVTDHFAWPVSRSAPVDYLSAATNWIFWILDKKSKALLSTREALLLFFGAISNHVAAHEPEFVARQIARLVEIEVPANMRSGGRLPNFLNCVRAILGAMEREKPAYRWELVSSNGTLSFVPVPTTSRHQIMVGTEHR